MLSVRFLAHTIRSYKILITHQGKEVHDDWRNELIIIRRSVNESISHSRSHDGTIARC